MKTPTLLLALVFVGLGLPLAVHHGTDLSHHNFFGGIPYSVGPITAATFTQPENEETLSISSNNPSNLVGAVTDFSVRVGGAGTNKYTVSLDGGSTWSDSFVPLSGIFPVTSDGVTWQENRDPAIAVDSQQNVYMAGIYQVLSGGQSRNANPASGVYVCQGTLPFVSFSAGNCHPVFTSTSFGNNQFSEDKSSIATDNSTSSFSGNVYATWVHFTGCTALGRCKSKSIVFSRSTDQGVTWSAPLTISVPRTNVQWPQITVGSDGTIYVAYEVMINLTMGVHFLATSSDGGLTFTPAQGITAPYQDLSFSSTYRKNSAPNIMISPVPGAEFVYDLFAVQNQRTSNIVMTRSNLPKGLGGFTTPVSINDSTIGQRLFPAAAVDASGTVHVAWFDTRNSRTVSSYDVYATYTQDLGVTFAPNARVTPTLINAGGSAFIGDYIGMAVQPNASVAHPVWSNNQLQTTTLTIP